MKKILMGLGVLGSVLFAAPIDEYMKTLEVEAKAADSSFTGFSAKRGEAIFLSKHIGKRGKEVSCASCHTNNLNQAGENIFTGKTIEALSPKANPQRLTKLSKVKKWLRRNFNDVYKHEGSAQQKGDVLTYIRNF
jgi:mono/diheme cytochrome c family protein